MKNYLKTNNISVILGYLIAMVLGSFLGILIICNIALRKGLVMEYANLPLVYRILIFIAAWLMIAGFDDKSLLLYAIME